MERCSAETVGGEAASAATEWARHTNPWIFAARSPRFLCPIRGLHDEDPMIHTLAVIDAAPNRDLWL